MNRVIVTGGTGVTGNALVRFLLAQGMEVTVLIRPNSARRNNLPDNVKLEIVELSLEQYKEGADKFEYGKYDMFFHLAWDGSMGKGKVDNRNNVVLQHANACYLLDAIELCKKIGCHRFLATGTQAEYGIVSGMIYEDTPENPQNAYGRAKVYAKDMAMILCKQYNIDLIWARLFSVYGPYDGAQSLIDLAVRKILYEKCSLDYTSGEQSWNYLYSMDAAKALYLLALYGQAGQIYNVASKKTEKLKEYILKIHRVVDETVIPSLGAVSMGTNAIINLEVNTDKLILQTGFTEDYSFEEGIKEIVLQIRGERDAGLS